MSFTNRFRRWLWLIGFFGLWPAAASAWAQLGEETIAGPGFGFGKTGTGVVVANAQFTTPAPDKPARLFVTARIQRGWHIYSITQKPGGPIKTQITLEKSDAFRITGDFKAHPAPTVTTQPEAFGDLPVELHEGTVVWYAPMEFSSGVDPTTLKIAGKVKAQPCDATSCLPPQDFPFTATVGPGVEIPAAAAATTAPASAFNAQELKKNVAKQEAGTSLWLQLAAGFLGGIILNLMPCVLPVIGLKILSFVEQSGHDRKTALLLNVWYSLGLLAVFWLLAGLAIGLNLGWGMLFQKPGFNVFIAALVFAMALAFLGVWEFPVPGFVGRGRAVELAEKEGAVGALFKGAITTVLATPCTGPFMGGALAWALAQPAHVVFAVFTSVGLGMASPYLLIGAFPKLVRFLPKPGAWMDTFKQVMGFVLLGTVVFVFTFMEASYVVPTVGLLFALWLTCWWIGRTPLTAELPAKARAWLEAAAIVGIAWLLLFPGLDRIVPGSIGGLHRVMQDRLDQQVARASGQQRTAKRSPHELPWEPFTSREAFASLVNSGKTVLVDFTADWCATCKTLEALYLNTQEVRSLVERNGVVTLKADWTHEDPEVTAMLNLLGAQQVPVLAIFSAGKPNEPARFVNGYTKTQVLDALEKAGPSRPSSPQGESSRAAPR